MTQRLFDELRSPPHSCSRFAAPDHEEDATLALYGLYELHYGGFSDVDDRWEWEPSLLRLRAELERGFESEVRSETSLGLGRLADADDVVRQLESIAAAGGPSLSQWVLEHGTCHEMREFAIHRSAYQLKEADPHTWAVPRLRGVPKAALVEIQHGEYGEGRAPAMHAELFADTMRELNLEPTYGAYLDLIPSVTLRTVNLVSMFGLHRRLRGALIGHLALFEMCSVVPMGRYAAAMRRLGIDGAAPFYDAHVAADEQHALIARKMVHALATDEPARAADIVFGARALDLLERRFAAHLIDSWTTGRTSLRASC